MTTQHNKKYRSVGFMVGSLLWASFAFVKPHSASAESFVGIKLSKQACLGEDNPARTELARTIFEKLTAERILDEEVTLVDFFKKDEKKRSEFLSKLGQEMKKRECAFSRKMNFVTVHDTLTSLSEKTFKLAEPLDIPNWMKPGFTAVLAGFDSDSSIVIETNEDGFIFHRCERDESSPSSIAPPPSLKCPHLFNSAVFIPIERMMLRESGIKFAVLSALKALANVSLIVTSNLGIAAISPITQTVVNLTNPTTVADLQRDRQVKTATEDLLRMGEIKDSHHDGLDLGGPSVTRLLPFKFDDLKQALIDLGQKMNKQMYRELKYLEKNPINPNGELLPYLAMERKYRDNTRADFGKPAPVDPGK